MHQERLLNQTLYAKVNGKRPVGQPRKKWLSWVNPLRLCPTEMQSVLVLERKEGTA